MSLKILVTCPPMLGLLEEFTNIAKSYEMELIPAKVTQTLNEETLIELLPNFDGWIIGDDPATRKVLMAGKKGRLKAAVKWGIGVDNVDFTACKELGIPITNTPLMFGAEVADVALGYIIGLARKLFWIDREIRHSITWPKPPGISLAAKKVGVVGHGDIGKKLAKRLMACDIEVIVYDPFVQINSNNIAITQACWPEKINELDFLVFTCSLSQNNYHMLNADILQKCKEGIRIVNVARGPLIEEKALIDALISKKVESAALDVFEEEPLPPSSMLRKMPQCIFGSHNSSNTVEAVRRASLSAIDKLHAFLLETHCEHT